MIEIKTIVAAVDFSEHSDAALDNAVALAKRFGAAVHIVHAYRFPVELDAPYEVSLPDDYLEAVRQVVHRKLEAAAGKVAAEGIEVKWHLVPVPEAAGISKLALDVGADLIVMGTRGNTGLEHVLLGSVAERTIRLAPSSVLTVKRGNSGEMGEVTP